MSKISRNVLFSKLNQNTYKALENAYTYSRFRENTYVELVHWLHVLLQDETNDIYGILKYFNVDIDLLKTDILYNIEKLPSGSSNVIDFSEHVERTIEEAWIYTSLKFEQQHIRSGIILYSILISGNISNILYKISQEFYKIKISQLEDHFFDIVLKSTENDIQVKNNTNVVNKGNFLERFSTNLTNKAKNGEIDPIVGRDEEIRQIIDILMRRRQNNPILIGEAGVGKTAVIEALALKIISGDIPPYFKDVDIYSLDIGLLKAGANVTGEFETRLRGVIDEIENSTKTVILFIDEIHTLIGAGGAAGTGDAANLLKPALARGKLRTIGATTWIEYKKYFEKDPALTRRFQIIQVNEPNEDKAIHMLRSLTSSLENHHHVLILDEAIETAVKLSQRYIPARQLPDKAVSLIDTACARVALSQHTVPTAIEQLYKTIENLEKEKAVLERESKLNYLNSSRFEDIQNQIMSKKQKLQQMEERWKSEKSLVEQLIEIRKHIIATDDVDVIKKEQQKELTSRLLELQGDNPLISALVDANSIAGVVSDWTGIPVGKMVKNELQSILNLSTVLNQRIIEQEQGIEEIVKRIHTSRAGLDDPNKPIGVFMLAGPSGVGKTETALALADILYGGEQNVITINMSEYQEAHTVSTLKGAPPGYVGYGEGGVLTEAVRRKPYSVILLDEIEKAHSDVHEIFFQVFDKGWMEDGEGRYIDFKNTIILLTSNVGTDVLMEMCDKEIFKKSNIENVRQVLREPLLNVFPPALLGRIQVIPYYPLSQTALEKIIRLQLERIVKRVKDAHKSKLIYTEEVIKLIASRCNEMDSGGRMIDSILTNSLLPKMSRKIIESIIDDKEIKEIHVEVINDDFDLKFY